MSILKPRKPRQPLQAVNLGHNEEEEDTTEVRRRRVSFAGVNKIKEFNSEAESVVICDTPAYEEEFGNSSDSSQILRNLNSSCSVTSAQQTPEKEIHGDSDMDISCVNMGVETVQPIYCVSQRSSNVLVEEISNMRQTPGYVPEYGQYQDNVNLSEDYMDITGTASPKYSPTRMSQHQISSMKMSLDCSLIPDVSHRSLGGINRSNFGKDIFHCSSLSDMDMATEYINKENLLNGRRSYCPEQSKLEKSVSSNFQICSSYIGNNVGSVNNFESDHVSNNKIDRPLSVPMNLRNFIVTDTSKSQFTQSPSHKRYRLSQLPDSEMEVTQVNNSIPLSNKFTYENKNSSNMNFYPGTDHLANRNSIGNMYPKQPPLEQSNVDEQSNHKAIYSGDNYLKSNLRDCSLLQDSKRSLGLTNQDNCKTNIEFHSSLIQTYPIVDDGKQPENGGLGSANVSITCVSAPDPHNFTAGCIKIDNSFNTTDSDSLCASMDISNIIAEKINYNLNKQGTKNKTDDETSLGNSCGFIRKSLVNDVSSPPNSNCSLMEQTKIVTVGHNDVENVSLTSKMLHNSATDSFQNKSYFLNKSDSKRKLEEMRKDELSETCSQARVDQVFCNKKLIAKRYSQAQNYNSISRDIEGEEAKQSADVTKGSFKIYSQVQAAEFELYDCERAKDNINQSSHGQILNTDEDKNHSQVHIPQPFISGNEEVVNKSTKNDLQITMSQSNSAPADSVEHYSQVPTNDSSTFSYEYKDSAKRYSQVNASHSNTKNEVDNSSMKRYSQVPNSLPDAEAVKGLNNSCKRYSQVPSQQSALFPHESKYYSETTPEDQILKPEIVSNDDSNRSVEKVDISRHEVMEDNNKNLEQNRLMDLNTIQISEPEVSIALEYSPVEHSALNLICEQKEGEEEAKQFQNITPELNLSDKVDSVDVTTEQECPIDKQIDASKDEKNSVSMELEKFSWDPLIEESQLPEEFDTQKPEFEVDANENKENQVSSPLIVDASCTSEFKEHSACDVRAETTNPICGGVVNESAPLESPIIALSTESSENDVIGYLSSDKNQINQSSSDQIIECSNNEPINISAPLYVDQMVENIKESIMDMSVSDEVTKQGDIKVAESSMSDSAGTSLSDVKKPGDIFSPLQLHNKHFMENLGYHFFEWTSWTKKFFNKSITVQINVSWIQFDTHTPILDASLQLDEKCEGKALKFCSSEIVRKLNELDMLQKLKTLEDTDRIFTDILKVVKDITPLYESLQNVVLYIPSDIASGRLVIYLASIKSVTAADVQINLTNWDSLSRNDITIVTHVGKVSLSKVRSLFFSVPSGKKRFYNFACALERLIG